MTVFQGSYHYRKEQSTQRNMKLYVLGPAFGLPSIDAECTAAVALLKVFCRKHHQAWELVATHEHGSTTSLPLLVDGGCTTRGYKSIARYLAKANGDIDGLLTGLSPKQKADHAALVGLRGPFYFLG